MRVLRFALEERLGRPVLDDHAIPRGLPMAAGDVISHYRVGKDGRTAEFRRTGKLWKKMIAEFGERVFYRPALAVAPRSGMQAKLLTG